jgi:hypothetical protein
MTFHTDVDTGDMLSMFLQSVPLEGGDQFLASMASVYNDLMSHNPGPETSLRELVLGEIPPVSFPSFYDLSTILYGMIAV